MATELRELLQHARKGVVLTVNKRLAASLVHLYDQAQVDAGETTWAKPNILPLKTWLAVQAKSIGLSASLLSDRQNLRLWEEIVEQDTSQRPGLQLLQTAATARMARDAHALLLQYGGHPDRYPATEESRLFTAWLKEWSKRTSQKNWKPSAALTHEVTRAIEDDRLAVPGALVLVGFDLIPPDLQQLIKTSSALGCEVIEWRAEKQKGVQCSISAATDPREEVEHCARWVRKRLLQSPNARIGIVAPRLDEYRSALASTLQANIAPETVCQPDATHPANFSLGPSLDQQGSVKLALSLLALSGRVELSLAGWLLRSPYLGGAMQEHGARALADRELRRKGQSVLGLNRLTRILEKQGSIPTFVQHLRQLQTWARESGPKRPGVWAEKFTHLLEKVGWPGDRPLDSRDYKAIDKLTELLTQLASLDRVSTPITRTAAVSMLLRMAQEEEFQIEDDESNIQVLGLLESAGQSFDSLWILGMYDTALPAPPRPNPFLPLALQKERQMPHADATRELEFAEHVCQRLYASSTEVIVSWPESIDGAECRPSPLLAGLHNEVPEMEDLSDPRALLGQQVSLESRSDSVGPSLPPGRTFSGGTGILKDQALCPFRAFAHYRLRSQGLDVPDIGLDPMSRGTLVHGLLEDFWQTIETHERLTGMSEEQLAAQLKLSAEAALDTFEREQKLDLPQHQRRLEKSRLQRIGRTWLKKEQERAPFKVSDIEKNLQLTLGPLAIRARIDRIDTLENGRQVVIDYKTGQPDTSQWYDSRVSEPQLPAYCLDLPEVEVGGALFARVNCRERDSRFYGVLHQECGWSDAWQKNLTKVLEENGWSDFSDLLQHWKTALASLADEFVHGEARVDPVELAKACPYCDYLPLCRRLEKDHASEVGHD